VNISNFIKILHILTLTDDHRLRVLESRALREMLGIKGVKLQETGEKCVLKSVRICFAVKIFWWSDQGD